jgi:hypothetical protein
MTDRLPRWLLAAKVLLAALLVTGAVAPQVGGFEGKGMAYRLPLFLAPALVVPLLRRHPYPAALDAALTLPFLFDTLGNALGIYDAFETTDDVLHAVNWFVLVGGVGWHLLVRNPGAPRRLVHVAATGIGGLLIIGWEAAEYGIMQLGVGNLHLTYGDTIADLLLSSAGGAVGATAALAWCARTARS